MRKSLFNTPVALVFFCRPDVLKVTFEAIKEARPAKLFLIQDGERQLSKEDNNNVLACREIVSKIDWDCEVHKNYSESNMGCGLRIYSGLSWVFTHADRAMIIEDDCVPSLGFFKFCEEILERYKNDERVSMVSGMNHLEIYDKTPYDYIFSQGGTIWGWATWKRVWDTIDFEMNWTDDEDARRLISNLYGNKIVKKALERRKNLVLGEKLTSWSFQHGLNMYFQHGLILIPKRNLTTNIGLTENSANTYVNSIKFVPKEKRQIYYMKTFDFEYPLKHPPYVINDIEYQKMVNKIMTTGHPVKRILQHLERFSYHIYYGDFKSVLKSIGRRIKRLFH